MKKCRHGFSQDAVFQVSERLVEELAKEQQQARKR